jgi:hypothetical protein
MRPPSSSCGRGRLLGRNRPAAATRRWRAWERFVAADAVVIKLRAGYPSLHPLMPERPVGVLVSVAHGQFAVTPSTPRAVALRHVRLVRVRRISAGNRSRKNKRRSTTQYRSAMASKPECHSDSLTPSTLQGAGVIAVHADEVMKAVAPVMTRPPPARISGWYAWFFAYANAGVLALILRMTASRSDGSSSRATTSNDPPGDVLASNRQIVDISFTLVIVWVRDRSVGRYLIADTIAKLMYANLLVRRSRASMPTTSDGPTTTASPSGVMRWTPKP